MNGICDSRKAKKEKEFYKGPNGEMLEKETVNYETTGALGKDRNTGVMYNGVLLKAGLSSPFEV